jgi:YbgC/YbaW family acyl-CoA thioester hydrolase
MEKIPYSLYTVRFSDCDPFAHLNNARYIDYFLNAREDHLKNVYDMDLKTFYQQGMTWFVGGHEIQYLKPADYNETVRIQTSLIKALPDALLVEMVMTDEAQSHIKSVMWTRFIPVNLKTGKRENHPEAFMAFAKSVEDELQHVAFSDRVKSLMLAIKETAQ